MVFRRQKFTVRFTTWVALVSLIATGMACTENQYNVGAPGSGGSSTTRRNQGGRANQGGEATGAFGGVVGDGTATSISGGVGSEGGNGGSAAALGSLPPATGVAGAGRSGINQGGTTQILVSGGSGPNSSGGISAAGGSAWGGGGASGGFAAVGGSVLLNSAGNSGASAIAGTGPCGISPNPVGDPTKRTMLLRDSGVSKLALVDVGNPKNSWIVPLTRDGRDMQLIGECRVMIGTDVGYEEYDVRTGAKLAEVTSYAGTYSAHRLRSKNTMLVGIGTQSTPFKGSVGIVLAEVDPMGTFVSSIAYPGNFVRLVRPTPSGTYLVANNSRVFEGDTSGAVLSPTFNVTTSGTVQVWKALRVPSASPGSFETVVSTGYAANLTIFKSDGTQRRTIGGGSAEVPGGAAAVNPTFFADFQLLSNGNYLVVNSLGAGPGNFTKGIPILEYTTSNALAWYWGDPAYAEQLSSIQAAIVLDGLDLTQLHVEDTNGQQVPVN